MAIVNDNIITRFQRGRFGDIIYRVVGSLSISSKAPDYSKIKWSPAQESQPDEIQGWNGLCPEGI